MTTPNEQADAQEAQCTKPAIARNPGQCVDSGISEMRVKISAVTTNYSKPLTETERLAAIESPTELIKTYRHKLMDQKNKFDDYELCEYKMLVDMLEENLEKSPTTLECSYGNTVFSLPSKILGYGSYNNFPADIRELTSKTKEKKITQLLERIKITKESINNYVESPYRPASVMGLEGIQAHLKSSQEELEKLEGENNYSDYQRDILSALADHGFTPDSFIEALEYPPTSENYKKTVGNYAVETLKRAIHFHSLLTPIFNSLIGKGYPAERIYA